MQILKLTPSERVRGRWLCHLADGTILRIGENEVLSFGLYTGMELDDHALERLDAALQSGKLREKALNLLSTRPMSRKELIEKLTAAKRKSDAREEEEAREDGQEIRAVLGAEAERIADWLEELGYLNDLEYAKTVVRHYSGKGYGQGKIREELWKRGIPRTDWEAAGESAHPPEEGIDAFLRQKLRGRAPEAKEWKRLSDALARRGYRWSEIKDGLRRYGAELEEGSC